MDPYHYDEIAKLEGLLMAKRRDSLPSISRTPASARKLAMSSNAQGETGSETSDGVPERFRWARAVEKHPVVAVAVAVATVLGAVATIATLTLQLWPSRAPEVPQNASATALRAASIHVGQPGSNVREIFGEPIKTQPVDGSRGFIQNTYVREDVASTVVVDSAGQIMLYSVMSCAPEANLRVTTSSGTTVTLQGPAIAEAETNQGTSGALNDRQLSYLEGGTGSSLGQLIESSVDNPRSGNGWRSYLVGINRACGETGFGVNGDPGTFAYFGTLDAAPQTLKTFREHTPANFYTEVSDLFTVTKDTQIIWPSFDASTGPTVGDGPALAAPYNNDLPPEFTAQYWAAK